MSFVSSFTRYLIARQDTPEGFDHVFYRKKYLDLAHLKTKDALLDHYIRHGRREGRFISLADARARLAQLGRILPADFRPDIYAEMNADLRELLDEEWQFELHYLEFGQTAGRTYFLNGAGEHKNLRNFGSFSGDLSDFDPDFYITYYQDLKGYDGQAAVGHFVEYGHAERRYRNLREAKEGLNEAGYVLPLDFSPKAYAQLNPSISSAITEPWQLGLHYALNGERMALSYRIFSKPQQSQKWKEIFDPYDFCLFDGRPSSLDRESALKIFSKRGICNLTPIARDWFFDPQFYRDHYGISPRSDAELYRDWLEIGVGLGRAPNENRAITPYVGEQSFYPTAFDWKSYSGFDCENTSIYPTKINALMELFERPLDDKARESIEEPGAADLYGKIGDYHLIRNNYETAVACYDLSCQYNASPTILTRKGDALSKMGRDSDALQTYQRAISFSSYSIWALIHYANISITTGDHVGAFEMLAEERPRWCGSPVYRRAVDECIERRFAQISEATWKLVRSGDVERANEHVDLELPGLTEVIRKLKVPESLSVSYGLKKAVILACLDLPQCTHYRVNQKVEQLGHFGFDVEIFDQKDPLGFMSSLPGATVAIFYRVPAFPKIIESILYARALGIVTFYDIDDLIFTNDFPEDFESYEDQITYDEFVGLRYGVPFFRHAISLCDVGLASTGPLAEHLRALVRLQKAHVVANGLDQVTIELMELMANRPNADSNSIRIFYGSGTKAHNRDFNDILGPALVHVLERYPLVNLTIVGYLALGPEFDRFSKRICRINFVENRSEYMTLLAACDINLAILSHGVIADCKSEIKWLEAAIFKVPTIASRTKTYEDILSPPQDGLVASSTADWIGLLSQLIESRELRRDIGAAAYRRAVNLYNSTKIGRDLVAAFESSRSRVALPWPATRNGLPHILICNVFFAPQSIGGATRVVEANVDYFIDKFSSVFSLSVLATDDGMTPGGFRVDTYRGVTVYRIATPYEINMDWRPFNDVNVPIYSQILDIDRPCLVHFHCIQRLTASLVEETLNRGITYLVTAHDAWWISDHQFLFDKDNLLVAPTEDLFSSSLPTEVTRSQSVSRREKLGALLNAARYTLAVSETFGSIYEQAGIRNVRSVPNGIGPLPARSPSRARADKLVLGHIGGRSVHKGAALLEIVLRENAFANLELIMIDGSIEAGHEIRTLWGETTVSLQGVYPQERINELFAAFDVLVAPSIWPESFGLVAREALFYGKWIVTSNIGAIGEDVIDGENGFIVEILTTSGLKTVLEKLNTEPYRYKLEIQDTHLRSADDQAQELGALYQSLFSELSDVPRSVARSDS